MQGPMQLQRCSHLVIGLKDRTADREALSRGRCVILYERKRNCDEKNLWEAEEMQI